VQNVDRVLGKYIISDRPMTEQEWAAERATVIDDVVEELLRQGSESLPMFTYVNFTGLSKHLPSS
jgi:hypothetical protein